MGIHLGVDEHAEPAAVDSEAPAGIDIESAAGTGYKAQVLESGMAFIVDALEKLTLYFRGSFSSGIWLITKLEAARMAGVMSKGSPFSTPWSGWR